MNFNKTEFNMFRNDVNNALAEIAKKYDLTISAGNISYTDVDFTMKLKCEKASGVDARKTHFNELCRAYGFEESDYERVIVDTYGKRYKLVGFKPIASKTKCIVEGSDGKTYKCPVDFVKHYFK